MNTQQANTFMLEAAGKTFESMAFIEVFPATEVSIDHRKTFQVRMTVDEPSSGEFILLLPSTAMDLIAENIFAQPIDEIKDGQINDLLAELLNTIGGSFLINALPPDTNFTLGLPHCTPPTPKIAEKSTLKWHFTLEEIPFSIYLSGEIIDRLNVDHNQ